MSLRMLILGLFAVGLVAPASAQSVDEEVNCYLEVNRELDECDCEREENEDQPFCLGLPPTGAPITNFAPITAGLAGLGVLAGALGGGSGATGTTGTTGTTSTVGN